ncbi:hypothetical protein ACNOYE_28300 [Nannocystaceae bacterium ST9]
MPSGPLCAATLRVELREVGGPPLLRRVARNAVARSGAELLAGLFTGTQAKSIDAIAVGIGEEPNGPPYELAALTLARPGGEPLISKSVIAIDPTTFEVETLDQELRVRVSLRTLIPADMAVHPDPAIEGVDIAEAALGVAAADGQTLAKIYNRVVFEPFRKARKHEVSLYWEISFPYGPNA